MDFYRVLRDNKELGPFSLEEIKKIGLKSSDLIWIDGKSAAWRFPDEITGLLTQIEQAPSASSALSNAAGEIPNAPRPKKRYRLTADHKMVEITEEEAASSRIPRIAEQPPAPKDEIIPQQGTGSYVQPLHQNEPVIPEEPFSKRVPVEPDPQELPLEPELVPKARTETSMQDFVDIDPKKQQEVPQEKTRNNNTGAFVFAGLLFLVAIAFFGYKWYQDQTLPQGDAADSTASTLVDTGTAASESFANSQAMALADDTTGRAERNREMLIADSIRRKQLADRNAAIAKARKDSIANAQQMQKDLNAGLADEATEPLPPVAPHKGDTSQNKVKKIFTTEDIGKYVRVGVVQPKTPKAGVSGVKLVVHNINNRNLSKVHINVMYFDGNGNIIKRATIIAPNVMIGKSVTVPVADDPKASNVAYKVTGLLGDHVNLQAK